MAKRIQRGNESGQNLSLFGDDELADDVVDSAELYEESEEPKYVTDPSDGLLAEVIKAHSHDKHAIVKRYVDICRPVRRRWVKELRRHATYIDLFCGPGHVCDQMSGDSIN